MVMTKVCVYMYIYIQIEVIHISHVQCNVYVSELQQELAFDVWR